MAEESHVIPLTVIMVVLLAALFLIVVFFFVIRVIIENKTNQFETETGGKRNLAVDLVQSSCTNGFSTTASLYSPKESMEIYAVAEFENKIYLGRNSVSNPQDPYLIPYPRNINAELNFDMPEIGTGLIHVTFWEKSDCILNYFNNNDVDNREFIELTNKCGKFYLTADDAVCGTPGSSPGTINVDGAVTMTGVDVQPGATYCRPHFKITNTGPIEWESDDKVKAVVQCFPSNDLGDVYYPPRGQYLVKDVGQSDFSPLTIRCEVGVPSSQKAVVLYSNCDDSRQRCAGGTILDSVSFTCENQWGAGGLDCRPDCQNPELIVSWDRIDYWLVLCIEGTEWCVNTLTNPSVCDFGQITDDTEATCELPPNIPYTIKVMAAPSADQGPFGGFEYLSAVSDSGSRTFQCSGSSERCSVNVNWPGIWYDVILVKHGTLEGACADRTDPVCDVDNTKSTSRTSATFQGLAPLYSYDAYVTVWAGQSRLHEAQSNLETGNCEC